MIRSRALAVAIVAAVVFSASWFPLAAGAQTETEREQVQDQRREVEEELDVLAASDAEIDAVLGDIEAAIAAQEAAVADAQAAAVQAEREEQDAAEALRQARDDVAELEHAISEMAVASFVHPPSVDLVQSLQALSLSDALLQKTYLDARAKRDLGLLDLLEIAEVEAGQRAEELAAASAAADEAVAVAETELAALGQERARQQALADDLQDRIDARLAEAAVLADMDAELAAQIQAEQAELIARLPPPTDPVVPTSAPEAGGGTTTTTTTATSGGTGGGGAPTTTAPTTAPPPPSPDAPPLRTVQGITVHADIADDVDALLTAAAGDGVPLSGWGYRSTERQIELRRQNCGPTYYDIWIRPASTCNPPTAVPGRSLHEQGRAIDFTYQGRVISSRSSPAFQWLAEHAANYGLFNLPSEPWHWSTNGG